jgi:hypothetical protein
MVTVTRHHPSAKSHLVAPHLARTPPGRWALAVASAPPHVVHHGTYLVYAFVAAPTAVAVVVVLVVWRSAKRERASRALAERLASPDPRARRRVLDEVDDEVLARHSATLFELLTREQDPDVLDSLAAAVARSRWEPTDDRNLIELRRWVAGSHTRTTASTPAEPEVVDAAPVVPAPVVSAPVVAPPLVDADDVEVDDHWAADPLPDDEGAEEPIGAPNGAVAHATVDSGDAEVPPHAPTDELADFIPTVRALIGGEIDRVELALITGTVLKTWSATDNGRSGQPAEESIRHTS